jgi:hypothetical protein
MPDAISNNSMKMSATQEATSCEATWVSQHFMEPESSLRHSHELSICSYPEPDQSSPHHPLPPLQDPA